jgi:protein MpaA
MQGVAILLTLMLAALVAGPGGHGGAGPRAESITLGRSHEGVPIRVSAFGDRRAQRRVLVVGCIHGTECAGTTVVRRMTPNSRTRGDTALWLLRQLNPDGHRSGVRVNGRGVDLNRNFASGWRPIGQRWDPQYSGPRPWSEPETRAARRAVLLLRPQVTIWFHQQATPLVRAWGRSVPEARRYARLAGLPFHRMPWLAGTAPNWQNHAFPGTSSFVVELPPGPASPPAVARHVAAIGQIASGTQR